MEVIITSILMCVIMALTDDGNGVPRGPLAPLLIGVLVVIGASMGPLTGFAMNPARDFGPKLFVFFAGWGEVAFTGGREDPVLYRSDCCANYWRLRRCGLLPISDWQKSAL